MSTYEYKAVPAPVQGTKARGVKSSEDRFALTLTNLLNEMSAEGWEYVRAETLPSEERKGLTGRETVFQNVLIFRRWTGPTSMETLFETSQAEVPTLTLTEEGMPVAPPLGPATRD